MRETTEAQRELANIGRAMMDAATTTKDSAVSNELARVGCMLTEYDTIYGPKLKDFNDADHALIYDFNASTATK
jgi:hypothetical protein